MSIFWESAGIARSRSKNRSIYHGAIGSFVREQRRGVRDDRRGVPGQSGSQCRRPRPRGARWCRASPGPACPQRGRILLDHTRLGEHQSATRHERDPSGHACLTRLVPIGYQSEEALERRKREYSRGKSISRIDRADVRGQSFRQHARAVFAEMDIIIVRRKVRFICTRIQFHCGYEIDSLLLGDRPGASPSALPPMASSLVAWKTRITRA